MIHAPFNFVPLSDKVFFPDWADQISQDIPFEDGLSGTIDIELKAVTPMFVRNGHTKEQGEEETEEYCKFSTSPDGRLFIPATTIKGTIRNAVEILSFGKMSHMNNKRYAMREMTNTYLKKFNANNVHCGWMKFDEDNVIIEDHGIPYRVSHSMLDEKYGTDFCERFDGDDGNRYLNNKKENRKIARHKYDIFGKNSLMSYFQDVGTCTKNPVDGRRKVSFSNDGWEGTIVFTGQPGERRQREGNRKPKASGKFYEFVFKEECQQTFILHKYQKEGLYEDFRFIYKDSEDWKFWEEKLNHGQRIPIFMLIENGKLLHFGLSYLYKLPTPKRLKEYLYDDHKQDKKKDLAECIFGTTDGTSLKGRVMFSHAFCKEGHLEPEQKVYMASPKPAYYPIYLKQQGECGFMEVNDKIVFYKTLLDSGAELKGWKKYPIRNEATSNLSTTITEGQDKNSNPFRPVASGSIFSGSVVFHNLKKFELAALVYGLELKNEALHSIGFAKPYGYGATKITVNKITGCDLSVDELRLYYEDCMEKEIPNYKKRNEVKEFFCMSKSQTLMTGYSLSYMTLDEFVKGKLQHKNNDRKHNAGNYLPYYSEMLEQPKKQQKPLVPIEATAKVTYDRRGSYEAALLNGKDTSAKKLDLKYSKDKLRMGDIIVVEIIQNAGRISSLVYKHKA